MKSTQLTKEQEYYNFLRKKIIAAPFTGIDVARDSLHPKAFPHQRDIAAWALYGGCRAIFAQFGLGKSVIQLIIGQKILEHRGGRFLIIAPFSVIQEMQADAENILGIPPPVYVKNKAETLQHESGILITNYARARDGDIDPGDFVGVTLDEASVLRGYGTKTYQTFLPKYQGVEFRFVATATPAPNKYKELIHYAGFLGVMDTGEALTRFFQRNSQKANDLTLYPHKEQEFWFWVSSWAVFLFKPSDLGYSDEGYNLPKLKVIEHRLSVDHTSAGTDSWGNVRMFREGGKSLPMAAKEKRDSLDERAKQVRAIVEAGSPDDHWLIWHDLEAERKALEKEFSQERKSGDFHSVYGSMKKGDYKDAETRDSKLRAFGEGEYRILATKPVIAGSGCNFQKHCYKAIFMGIGFKFNDFIQAVHRIHRFLQTKEVEVHLIYMESEDSIFKTLMQKWKNHDKLVEKMRGIVQKYGLNSISKTDVLARTIGVEREYKKGKTYTAVHNDCVPELWSMPENSQDMICTSIPFGTQYEYCPSYNDFGHNSDNEAFFRQMDFMIPELLRVLKPGRICAIHCKDRIQFGGVTGRGVPTVDRFSDKTADAFERHGFFFMSRITITTDVVRENNQTYRLGWSENAKDSTKMGAGMPEYVLIFRKPQSDLSKGYADIPVTKDKTRYTRGQWQIDAHAFWKSSGDRLLTPTEWATIDMDRIGDIWQDFNLKNFYNYDYHIDTSKVLEEKGRLPATFMLFTPVSENPEVWTDILRFDTLNSNQIRKKQEKHVCPLQLDLVERLIRRYTNEGECVLDPFAGLHTVPYVAVKMNRKGYGIELNHEYWANGCRYMHEIEYKKTVPTLFDVLSEAENS